MKDGLNLVKTKGDCSLNLMPYVDGGCTTQPTVTQNGDASNNKALNWVKLAPTDITGIKNAINLGLPVVIATPMNQSYMDMWLGNGIWSTNYGATTGGHATCIVGYDDNKQMFKVENSMGTGGGDSKNGNGGFYWITYNNIQNGCLLEAYILYGTNRTTIISGTINHPSNTSGWIITNATVATGVNTNSSGNYSISLSPTPSTYTITPSKLANQASYANGVNVTDLSLIRALILQNLTSYSSPYEYIAADVNGDGLIDNTDLSLIQSFILHHITSFASTAYGQRLYAFLPTANAISSYTPTAITGTSVTAPSYIQSLQLNTTPCGTYTNQNFYGFPLGDVNWDWNYTTQSVGDGGTPIGFSLNSIKTTSGSNIVKVPIKVSSFNDIIGMQFTLSFDTTVLEWSGIHNNSLGLLYNKSTTKGGKVSFLWTDSTNKGKTLADSAVIVELVFKKKGEITSESIDITSDVTPIAVVRSNFAPLGLMKVGNTMSLTNETVGTTIKYSTLNVSPNPSNGNIKLNIDAIANKQVQVQVFDAVGKLMWQNAKMVTTGNNTILMNLNSNSHFGKGNYYIKVVGLEKDFIKPLRIVQ
jgi:hypothetical protein